MGLGKGGMGFGDGGEAEGWELLPSILGSVPAPASPPSSGVPVTGVLCPPTLPCSCFSPHLREIPWTRGFRDTLLAVELQYIDFLFFFFSLFGPFLQKPVVVINSCTDSATYFGVKSRAWLRELRQLRNMQFLHPALPFGEESEAAQLQPWGTRARGDPAAGVTPGAGQSPPALPNTAPAVQSGMLRSHGAGNAVPTVRGQKGAGLPPQIPRTTPKQPWDIPGPLQGSVGPRVGAEPSI